MRIVLLGPPGVGKGSLAALYERRLRIAHISTGEIFRQEIARDSALGRQVQRYVTSGRLVPDPLVVQVMAARLSRAPAVDAFVLDGFPRTVGQARGLDRVLHHLNQPLDGAVYLTAPAAVLVRRLSGRRVCPLCGANYNIRTMRPKLTGRCDRCGGRLMIRKDDQPATIRKRLAIDRKAATPLVAYYHARGLLSRVSGVGSLEATYARSMKLFHRLGWWRGGAHDRVKNRRGA